MAETKRSDYDNTSVTPHFTIDGGAIAYENVLESDRQRIFAVAEEHARTYRDLGFEAEFAQSGAEDATLTVKFGRHHRRTAALLEIFKGMIMATVVKTSWGGGRIVGPLLLMSSMFC